MNKLRRILGSVAVFTTILLPSFARHFSSAEMPVNADTRDNYSFDVNTTDADTRDNYSFDVNTTDADTTVAPATTDTTALSWQECIRTDIQELLKSSIFNTSMVGMLVYDLTADSVIFEYNHKQLMRPASTIKMMIAVTALDRLGADYKYRTRMAYTGEIDSLTLNGNIYVKGGMDPTIDNDELTKFVNKINDLGIDTINGNICLDLSMKDSDLLGEGWCWDDDNPVLTALPVSRKDEFGKRLMSQLRLKGITVTGSCRNATMPHNAKEIYTKTTPLLTVMKRQLKKSDNLYSESMFYQIAADHSGRNKATARHGREAVNRLISSLGFRPSEYYIADGSGLSLYNYVSPELEVAFLKHAYRHKNIYDNLLPCLPIAGEDGTLSERMNKSAAHRNVKAKTGTVTGVSALAGYCTASNGHTLCFSIINMGIRKAITGRNFQDKVCQALCK